MQNIDIMKFDKRTLLKKIKARLWAEIVSTLRHTRIYPIIYTSYWHKKFITPKVAGHAQNYFTAVPNTGAGIGHQLANWIAGYWFAKQFGLTFAHTPFSENKWETFFGFGENELSADDLVENSGYRKVLLPLFDETNHSEIDQIKKIIESYTEKKVVFVAEQDQFYRDQFGVISEIKMKFYNGHCRQNDRLIYSNSNFNVAIHVRRGDITIGQENKNENLLMRWQDNDYFVKVLSRTLEELNNVDKPISIYLFSQGAVEDFTEFADFKNINFCLGMNAQQSFLHMVYADVLITSKSSFSYKPALLSNGIKVCPDNFWHGYPDTDDFIIADSTGNFKSKLISSIIY